MIRLPWWLSGEDPTCNAGDAGDLGFNPWVKKIHWGGKWQPTPVFLQDNPMDRGVWQNIVHGVTKI